MGIALKQFSVQYDCRTSLTTRFLQLISVKAIQLPKDPRQFSNAFSFLFPMDIVSSPRNLTLLLEQCVISNRMS